MSVDRIVACSLEAFASAFDLIWLLHVDGGLLMLTVGLLFGVCWEDVWMKAFNRSDAVTVDNFVERPWHLFFSIIP